MKLSKKDMEWAKGVAANYFLHMEAAEVGSALACNGGGIDLEEFSDEAVQLFWSTLDAYHERLKAAGKPFVASGEQSFIELWAEVESVLRNGD